MVYKLRIIFKRTRSKHEPKLQLRKQRAGGGREQIIGIRTLAVANQRIVLNDRAGEARNTIIAL